MQGKTSQIGGYFFGKNTIKAFKGGYAEMDTLLTVWVTILALCNFFVLGVAIFLSKDKKDDRAMPVFAFMGILALANIFTMGGLALCTII